jgi:hypothetical protein
MSVGCYFVRRITEFLMWPSVPDFTRGQLVWNSWCEALRKIFSGFLTYSTISLTLFSSFTIIKYLMFLFIFRLYSRCTWLEFRPGYTLAWLRFIRVSLIAGAVSSYTPLPSLQNPFVVIIHGHLQIDKLDKFWWKLHILVRMPERKRELGRPRYR